MIPSRRAFMLGAAALSATLASPEQVFAAAAMRVSSDWSLATVDVEGDIPPRAMRLIHGRAPAGLEGTLFRNGPAKFRRPGGSATHWFDGDGLMRSFDIRDGQATLAGRFADTPKRRLETRLDAIVTPGFGTVGDARAEVQSADDTSVANTSVLPVGDKVWALWEGGSPMIMDADTLATEGFATLRPDLAGMPFLAHPRIEPDGRVWNLGLNGDKSVVWRLSPDGTLEDAGVIAMPRASYLHDFTATERHLVIVLQPWLMEKEVMPFSSRFAWRPEQGTQVWVIDKADLAKTRTYELPAFAFFHLGEAWEDNDGTIRFDVCAHDDASFIVEGASNILQGRGISGQPAHLAGITLRPDGRASFEKLSITAEFPKNDPRLAGLRHDLTVHVTGETSARPLPTAIAVHDWNRGTSTKFDFGDTHVVEEMVFVPKPGSSAERDAWLVGTSINLKSGVTELHAFDVARVADGPVATWAADIALPAGFHGAWKG